MPDAVPANAIAARVLPATEILLRFLDGETMDLSLWPVGWPHEAPELPFMISGARQAMRGHLDCALDDCPRKLAAWRTLVEAGVIHPDYQRLGRYIR
ncbi:hypothetical protein AB0H76_18080 [Nocardia sp. NPDC050712]|uniref:hypothetical protein n=1 Tax=Nocardia sp. NPDC050712 TaxID=3155518 RepID=UPI0033EC2372